MPLVAAKQSFRLGTQMIRQGDVLDSDDSIVSDREHMFEPVANRVRTTAAIGRPAETPPPAVDTSPDRPAGNASRDKWATYVESLGGEIDEDATRADLVALADTLEAGG